MNGVRIEYGGVAIGAKENFAPSTPDKAQFIDLGQLRQEISVFNNYGNPCDLYSVILDGTSEPLPEDLSSAVVGWWSNQTSADDGTFDGRRRIYSW